MPIFTLVHLCLCLVSSSCLLLTAPSAGVATTSPHIALTFVVQRFSRVSFHDAISDSIFSDKPRYQGKAYCLDHYKEQESYSYGMDAELKAKQDAKYDPKKEAEAQAWIEAMLGERFPDSFHESLKSGVRLCQ